MNSDKSEEHASEHTDAGREHCGSCRYAVGSFAEAEQLHCGLTYYKVPAKDRRPLKLAKYPVVSRISSCINWKPRVN